MLKNFRMDWSDIVGALKFQTPYFSDEDFKVIQRLKNPKDIVGRPDVSDDVQIYIRDNERWIEKSERILKYLRSQKINWVTPGSPFYPKRFSWMLEAPTFLTYLGDIACADKLVLSVVGSREPSAKGKEFINQELGNFLKSSPLTIVSGAARGIDQAAHNCALRNQCPTVAVMPSGLLNPYPKDFKTWYEPIIAAGGCVMSEYLPEKFMQRHHFFRRNQIIVGLSKYLLVVEARRRSGSIMTAKHALDNHCDVAVVPGFPFDPQYGGSLDLIYDGGRMIRDHVDLDFMINSDVRRQLN